MNSIDVTFYHKDNTDTEEFLDKINFIQDHLPYGVSFSLKPYGTTFSQHNTEPRDILVAYNSLREGGCGRVVEIDLDRVLNYDVVCELLDNPPEATETLKEILRLK